MINLEQLEQMYSRLSSIQPLSQPFKGIELKETDVLTPPGQLLKIDNVVILNRQDYNTFFIGHFGMDAWLEYRFKEAQRAVNWTIARAIERLASQKPAGFVSYETTAPA